MSKGGSVVVGYKYSIGIHMAICCGPIDSLLQIIVGDRLAWEGNQTASGDIYINKPALFGDTKREGGVVGTVTCAFGESTQGQNSYLASQLGSLVPAFRGITSFILNHVYIGTNPYLKNWAFTVKRIPAKTWYPAKSAIGNNANPAHIVYECITNPDWGMGYQPESIDDTIFKAAADIFYTESFGLSLLWNQQSSIGDFIRQVLDHTMSAFRLNQRTGLFELVPIRANYNVNTLPIINTSNAISLDSYQRAGWGEVVNQITVTYTIPAGAVYNLYKPADVYNPYGSTYSYTAIQDTPKTVVVQDNSSIQMQGGVIAQQVTYPGIRDDTVANLVAMRDLKAQSTPLSALKITVNRSLWDLYPGDVFKLIWPPLGIDGVVYRVGDVDYGSIEEGKIGITAIEDVFGMPTNSYVAVQPIGWIKPTSPAISASYRYVYEAPYFDLVRMFGQSTVNALSADVGYLMTSAAKTSSDAQNYDIWDAVSGSTLVQAGLGHFSPMVKTVNAMAQEVSTVVTYDTSLVIDIAHIAVGDYAVIEGEFMAVTAINTTAHTITFNRGVLDTVPTTHAAGTSILFPYTYNGYDQTQFLYGETINVKLLTTTPEGTLALASAPNDSVYMNHRMIRPYVPGNVKFNSSAYPSFIRSTLTLSWSHRDRTQQTAYLVAQNATDIGPEVGVTYTLKLYDENGTLRKTVNLGGNSYVWSTEATDCGLGRINGQITINLQANRSSYTSWQNHSITVKRMGYGLNYGSVYGS